MLPLAVAGLSATVPAMLSASASLPDAHGGVLSFSATGLVSPLPGPGLVAAGQAGQAAATCAAYASRAGWANNGYYAGDLVTAAAICVAESSGTPQLWVCDDNGSIVGSGTHLPVNCPQGTTSYDRGLWQLNSKAASGVSDACAFDPVCNAGQAYLFSGRGTSFAPWASYDQDTYARPFLDVVQAGVTRLSTGTVTSALLGECLAQARPARWAKVVIANCGTGAGTEQWAIAGGRLRTGSLCMTIAAKSGNPAVVLGRCDRARAQIWLPYGRYELRNAADGRCLTDPGSSLSAGTQVTATRCVNAKAQTWWLP
jgi:hypothetical protein